MREHEVPTHVQAEDRVLLWLTFPQIVAVVAVCALSYGAYRYAPVGPSEIRTGLAVLFGLIGIMLVVGKIGGRRLPLVAADLLKYRLGARIYAGQVSQLVRPEPPAPVQFSRSGPGPLRLMARRAGKTLKRLRPRRKQKRNGERKPFRRHGWFGKRRRKVGGERRGRGPKNWMAVVAVVALAAAATLPQSTVLADGHEERGWSSDEIEFQPPPPMEGRRIFVEGLTVSGDRAAVTLRASTDIDIRVRAFGGSEGTTLRFWGSASLSEGERIDYSLPLNGPVPSFTVSWEDTLGQAGAVTVESDRIPYPLPEVEGELCDIRMTSLGWTRRAVTGVIESDCVSTIGEAVELQTVAGHESVTETALMDAQVTAVTGTLAAAAGASTASVAFAAGGETRFTLPVGVVEAIHPVSVDVDFQAALRIPISPLIVLTHHPERTEKVTKTVHLYRPGASDSDSDTATATCEDGSTATATASAYAHVPATTIAKQVTVEVLHPEHVKAEFVERSPIIRIRAETLALASAIGADAPFTALALPEPEREDPPAEQTPAEGLRRWFERLGWEWPW